MARMRGMCCPYAAYSVFVRYEILCGEGVFETFVGEGEWLEREIEAVMSVWQLHNSGV